MPDLFSCDRCKIRSNSEFQKVIDLPCSGLNIYLHTKQVSDQTKWRLPGSIQNIFICNNKSRIVSKPDFMGELCRYNTKCSNCKTMLQIIRNLLDEIQVIQGNQIIGICEHCKKFSNITCRKCHFLLNKFLAARKYEIIENQKRFKNWLLDVKHLLYAMMNAKICCKHMQNTDMDLERILKSFEAPLAMGGPYISDIFSSSIDDKVLSESIAENRMMIKDILSKISTGRHEISKNLSECTYRHSDTFSYEESCMCKLIKKGQDLKQEISKMLTANEGLIEPSRPIEKDGFDLARQLSELCKTLAKGLAKVFDRATIQELIKGLKYIIDKHPANITIDLVKATAEVCKVVTRGLSKNLNKEAVYELISIRNQHLKKDASIDGNAPSLQKYINQLKDIFTSTHKTPNEVQMIFSKKEKTGNENKDTVSKENKKDKALNESVKRDGRNEKKAEVDPARSKSSKKEKKISDEEDGAVVKFIEENPRVKTKSKATKSEMLLRKLIAKSQNSKNKRQEEKIDPKDLPASIMKSQILALEQLYEESEAQSLSSCEVVSDTPECLIKGSELCRYKKTSPTKPVEYLQKKLVFEDPGEYISGSSRVDKSAPLVPTQSKADFHGSGTLRYRLSNKKFIEKGWTKLPTEKVYRQMMVFKANPAQTSWFERYKHREFLFYNTGEKLADFDMENSGFRWYYKNGDLAFECSTVEDRNLRQRYTVYDQHPQTVLAIFDCIGNGIVYDKNGNLRLKFNQSEGILIDAKIGTPCRWKWHTLNEPPLLRKVYINPKDPVKDPYIEQLGREAEKENKKPSESENVSVREEEDEEEVHLRILKAEFDAYAKSLMFRRKIFVPFEIKMKAFKINESFSLRVINQAKINLCYGIGQSSLKINLGVVLDSQEIVDSGVFDGLAIATPYDDFLS